MLAEIVPVLQHFRHRLYHFFPSRRDAAMELLDALSSNRTATSVVELSLSPLHRRNYCSITRVLDEFIPQDSAIAHQKRQALTKLLANMCPSLQKRKFHLFAVDCTPGPRVFSPTLEDRSYVYSPNAVCGNKPVTVGHKYSIAAYLPEKPNTQTPPWLVPVACARVNTAQNAEVLGMEQIVDTIKSNSNFTNALCVSVGDTAYNTPLCLGIVKNNVNQLHISRTRNNKKFYYPYSDEITRMLSKRGRPTVYGDLHKLNDPTTWHLPDELIEFSQLSGSGKMLRIKIGAWNEVIMRGKKNLKLSDYPLRLLRVQVFSVSGELLFKRPLWLTVAGKRRMELSLFDIYNSYRQRFDIEHFFRFGKTRLLMDKIQTPDVEHEEAWWQLVMIAYTQLYLSRSIAANLPNPWERHLPLFKQNETIKQPTIVQKDFERIIQMIGTPAQPPNQEKMHLDDNSGIFR